MKTQSFEETLIPIIRKEIDDKVHYTKTLGDQSDEIKKTIARILFNVFCFLIGLIVGMSMRVQAREYQAVLAVVQVTAYIPVTCENSGCTYVWANDHFILVADF